jgi:L-ascorbate metabolism protein UlaG (beta-lactamase superfamily)
MVAVSLVLLSLGYLGCAIEDGMIWGQVTDSRSGAPIDSVEIYVTTIAGDAPRIEERMLRSFTDDNGRYVFFTSGRDLHIVDAEKVGYLASAARLVKRGGEVNFVLVPVGTE